MALISAVYYVKLFRAVVLTIGTIAVWQGKFCPQSRHNVSVMLPKFLITHKLSVLPATPLVRGPGNHQLDPL